MLHTKNWNNEIQSVNICKIICLYNKEYLLFIVSIACKLNICSIVCEWVDIGLEYWGSEVNASASQRMLTSAKGCMLPVSQSLEHLGDVKHFAHSQKLLNLWPSQKRDKNLFSLQNQELWGWYCPSLLETTGIFANVECGQLLYLWKCHTLNLTIKYLTGNWYNKT